MMEFDYLIADDDKHEYGFIEIYFEGKYVALINQEKGKDKLEIEFPNNELLESLVIRKVPLSEFLDLIKLAIPKLLGQ